MDLNNFVPQQEADKALASAFAIIRKRVNYMESQNNTDTKQWDSVMKWVDILNTLEAYVLDANDVIASLLRHNGALHLQIAKQKQMQPSYQQHTPNRYYNNDRFSSLTDDEYNDYLNTKYAHDKYH